MRFRKALLAEHHNIARLYRRANASILLEHPKSALDESLDEDYLLRAIEEGRLFVLLDSGKILGCTIINKSVVSYFFPLSKSKEKEMDLLLQTEPHGDEPYIVIESIAVDPAYQKKGYGRQLFFTIADNYRGGLVLSAVNKDNLGAIAFFRAIGCLARGLVQFENHRPNEMVLLSYRLNERTTKYRMDNNIHAS